MQSPRSTPSTLWLLLIAALIILVFLPSARSQCFQCMDGVSMQDCPFPEFCGFGSLDCTSAKCPGKMCDPQCVNVTCSSQCMNGMPMPGCQDPGACGLTPTACVGCVVGQPQPGCPRPDWCVPCTNSTQCPPHDTPKCWGCVPGRVSALCPDPSMCPSENTYPCIGCVNGTVTDKCPDPSFCSYEPACYGCVSGTNRPTCPNVAACGNVDTAPCVDCMDGMAMPKCPKPDFCGFAPIPSGDGDSTCVMQMVFGASSSVCVFLTQWHVSSPAQWVAFVMGVLGMALLREFLLIHRQHRIRMRRLARTTNKSLSINGKPKRKLSPELPLVDDVHSQNELDTVAPLSSQSLLTLDDFAIHLIDSLYYLVSLVLAYLLMLLIMTYNIGVCVVVVVTSFAAHLMVTLTFSMLWRSEARRRAAANTYTSNDSGSYYSGPNGGGAGAAAGVEEYKQSEDPCCGDAVYDDFD